MEDPAPGQVDGPDPSGDAPAVGSAPPPRAAEPKRSWTHRWALSGPGAAVARVAAALVALGVLLRLLAPLAMDLRMDGDTYAAMGHAWAQHGSFLLPWGDVTAFDCTGPQLSHHYPPLYPLYLGLVYKAAGFGLWQTKLAAVAISLAALAVVFACTADLYSRATAWLVTGLLAVEPHLVWSTGTGFSENLVLLFFAITMWGILKSLQREAFILVAGLAAGFSYLTRAGMGAFFVVAGAGGFAWRFYYMRWEVLKNKWYVAAIAVFALFIAVWAGRNVAAFGWPHWETSSYSTYTQRFALDHPALLLEGLAWKAPLFLAYLLHYGVPFYREAAQSAREVRKEAESALWLGVVLVTLIGWAMASIYWTVEQYDVWWMDNHRYVVIAFLPLLWLALKRADLGSRSFRLRYGALAVSLVAISGYLFVEPVQFPETELAADLKDLEPGTQIGIEGIIVKYSFYPYLEHQDVSVYGCRRTATDSCPGQSPDYILSLLRPVPHPGYHVVDQSTVDYLLPSTEDWTGTLYARDGPGPIGPRAPDCRPSVI